MFLKILINNLEKLLIRKCRIRNTLAIKMLLKFDPKFSGYTLIVLFTVKRLFRPLKSTHYSLSEAQRTAEKQVFQFTQLFLLGFLV